MAPASGAALSLASHFYNRSLGATRPHLRP
jgi:hypothetical protein